MNFTISIWLLLVDEYCWYLIVGSWWLVSRILKLCPGALYLYIYMLRNCFQKANFEYIKTSLFECDINLGILGIEIELRCNLPGH